jgi:hypothetical protein
MTSEMNIMIEVDRHILRNDMLIMMNMMVDNDISLVRMKSYVGIIMFIYMI